MKNEHLKNGVIFPRGGEMPGEGAEAYLNMLVGFDDPFGCSIGSVTFSPGGHNNWHRHFGDQVLLVTGGEGLYQEWGKPAQKLKTGDVVIVPNGVKHWHGAAPDSWFVHIGMIIREEQTTEGLEVLSREEYLLSAEAAETIS